MNKILRSLILSLFALFVFAGSTHAASTSIRLQQPGTPTNKDTFTITFVALDTNPDQAVSVQCYKKGPSDGAFSAFGGVINLSNGGNTDNCQVSSGIMNQGAGTYQFYAQVVTGSTTPTSSTVSVDFNNSKPGQPVNYNKTKPDDCTYKISFRSANDSGKTVKVVLYRSADRSFSLDNSHKVNEVNIGSDTDGSMTDNISPNCNTEYFYAIRAFDASGNASDPVGDSSVTFETVNPTTTQQQGANGAIANGTNGNVLGSSSENAAGSKAVLGTESAKPTNAEENKGNQNGSMSGISGFLSNNKTMVFLGVVILLAVAYYLYRRFYKKV